MTGRKYRVTPGIGADGWLVTARLETGEPALLWIPTETPGVQISALPRIDGSPMGSLDLVGAEVSSESLLARGGVVEEAISNAVEWAKRPDGSKRNPSPS